MADKIPLKFRHCFEDERGGPLELGIACVMNVVLTEGLNITEDNLQFAIRQLSKNVDRMELNLQEEASNTLAFVGENSVSLLDDLLFDVDFELSKGLNNTNALVDESFNALERTTTGTVNEISRVVDAASDSLTIQANSNIENTNNLIDEITDNIFTTFEGVNMGVREVIDEVDFDVNSLVEFGINTLELLRSETTDDITNLVIEASNKINNQVGVITNDLGEFIEKNIQSNSDLIDSFTVIEDDKETSIFSGIFEFLRDISKSMIGLFDKSLSFIKGEKQKEIEDNLKKNNQEWLTLMEAVSTSVNNPDDMKRIITQHKDQFGWWGNMLLSFMYASSTIAMIVSTISISNASRSEVMRQNVLSDYPVNIFSLAESVAIHNRGFIGKSEAEKESLKSGYDQEHFERAKLANETPIDIERSTMALHRGLINENDFKTYLERQAFNENDSGIIRDLATLRPPVQDLISMSVRDVFSPDVVDKFGLFDETPSKFIEEAGKNGLSEEWASNYWGAHWRLPSSNQGFEMFHRDVIDSDTLDLLLKALDVAPFWRESLKAIAYIPVGRIDIRRMYALGLIDRQEVTRRHLDLGYSPADAERMTQFVVSLTPDTEDDLDVDIRDITQAQIKKLHLLGTITRAKSIGSMTDLGFDPDTAQMIVDSWDVELEINQRDDMLNRMIRKAIREDLTLDEVEGLFSSITLSNEERARVFQIIEIEQRDYDSIPSKSELKKMYEGNIITLEVWIVFMRRHNYSFGVIDLYKQLYEF